MPIGLKTAIEARRSDSGLVQCSRTRSPSVAFSRFVHVYNQGALSIQRLQCAACRLELASRAPCRTSPRQDVTTAGRHHGRTSPCRTSPRQDVTMQDVTMQDVTMQHVTTAGRHHAGRHHGRTSPRQDVKPGTRPRAGESFMRTSGGLHAHAWESVMSIRIMPACAKAGHGAARSHAASGLAPSRDSAWGVQRAHILNCCELVKPCRAGKRRACVRLAPRVYLHAIGRAPHRADYSVPRVHSNAFMVRMVAPYSVQSLVNR